MIVVLPFENLGAPEDEYFADGMTEEITSRLAGGQRFGRHLSNERHAVQGEPSLPEAGRGGTRGRLRTRGHRAVGETD